jgi:hypothetical protein
LNHRLAGGDLAPEKQRDGQHPLLADGPDFYGVPSCSRRTMDTIPASGK